MPLTEEQKKYQREYKKNNPQKMTEEQKQKRKEYMKQYNERKKQEKKEYYMIHNQKPEIKKQRKINEWKRRGLIADDYDAIHTKWSDATQCEECNIIFQKAPKTTQKTKCMDHCHITGEFRGIICHPCNVRRK